MEILKKTAVIIVTFNHRRFIGPCLDSLSKNGFLEIIVVDNNSSDGTDAFIKENYPNVNVVNSPYNRGYGAGVNLGVNSTKKDYIVVLNPDTKVNDDAIYEILKPLKDEKIITTPKILNYDGFKINTCGNIVHFTGLSFTRGLNKSPKEFSKYEYVNGISGACFAIKRENYINIGGFDENFFMYMEDTCLSWMASVKGYKILYVPKSVVYHDYALKVPPEKIYYLEKGRYMIMRKYLTLKEFIIISPSLLLTEILTWGYSIFKGSSAIKFKYFAFRYFLTLKTEKVDYNPDLFRYLDFEIPDDQLNTFFLHEYLLKFVNFVFAHNYNLLKH